MKFRSRSGDANKPHVRLLHKRYFGVIGSVIAIVLVIALLSHSYPARGMSQILDGNFLNSISNDYFFSQNKSEVSVPSNNSHTGDFGKGIDIALVKPTFTAAAYSYGGFYDFYRLHDNAFPHENITSNLGLLRVKVDKIPTTRASVSAYAILSLLRDVKWLTPSANVTALSDQDVDGGHIFSKDGRNAYDVVVLGHQEYVTQQEYNNFKQFVHNGGTMIILDGNVFYAQVSYDRATDTIQLVKGHGWAFNGKSAWRSVLERWVNETEEWVGSNYLCTKCSITFGNNPFGYQHHEEQYVTNPDDIILLNYNATVSNWKNAPDRAVVATYELNYGAGKVIALGIYSDDIISDGSFDRYFDSLLMKYTSRHNAD